MKNTTKNKVISGFFIVGTPAEQRKIRFDDQRISHLQTIQGQIINYWIKKELLPSVLDDLNDNISGFFAPKDPETGTPYGYKITGPLAFELCTTFKTRFAYPYPYYDSFQQNWEHEAEKTCFQRTIDPELYKTDRALKSPID